MKRSALHLSAALCAAALLTALAVAGRATGIEPPQPDLTGNWRGSYFSASDPKSIGEAAMRVDSQKLNRFYGKLALGRLVFDIQGAVTTTPAEPDAEPPSPDYQLLIMGAEPPIPDADPPGEMTGAMIMIRGTVRFIEPPTPDADPPGELVADYLILFADGSIDMGSLDLVQIGVR